MELLEHPQVSHIGAYLDFFDSQSGAVKKFEIGTAAATQSDGPVNFDSAAALATSGASGGLYDFEQSTDERRVFGRDIEAEANCIRHHAGQLANFEPNASYPRIADAIAYSLDDTFDDCQFVHH
jgi:hypothetical protein